MSADASLNVFISYRRDDAIGSAGRLFDWLVHQFGRSRVFLDTDKIASGEDFARVLEARLAHSDVVLVVIGPRCSTSPTPPGDGSTNPTTMYAWRSRARCPATPK
jgi:hypothetical protein